jgi:hypothetical protein
MADDVSGAGASAMRISDADRERVCARLREAFAEGRVTTEEFHERTAAALAAKTEADLAPLTSDLPVPVPPAPVVRSPRQRELRRIWTAWASMAVLLNAVWLLTVITSDSFPGYWPVWPLGVTGALAVVRTLNIRNSDDAAPAAPDDAAGGRLLGHRDRRRAR